MIASWTARAPEAHADASLSASALASRDDQGFQLERYEARWANETGSSGELLSAHVHRYALTSEFAGVLPFHGIQPAAELGGHLLASYWWLGAAAGFEGTPDLHGATGDLTLARAIPTDAGTFTPRLEGARGPTALTALPLSLGLVGERAQAFLDWHIDGWLAQASARVDWWQAAHVAGRVRNPVLDEIPANRMDILYAYFLSDRSQWIDAGLSAKVARAQHNTLLATELQPWEYSWYPISAPPFAWETALVLRAQARPSPSFAAALQLQLPVVSRETRQWESIQQSAWGTAPFEAKLHVHWAFLTSTAVELDAAAFAKPWKNWDVTGPGAYRQSTLALSLVQRI